MFGLQLESFSYKISGSVAVLMGLCRVKMPAPAKKGVFVSKMQKCIVNDNDVGRECTQSLF